MNTHGRDTPDTGRGAAAGERIFEALPPARGRAFAQTWWGLTWLKALEETALDNQQLKKGRSLARQGSVGAVSVRPGRITAVVTGNDRRPYRADVLLRQLDDEEWDRLLGMIADRAGHLAALLDRDMPPALVEDASVTGLDLLPGIGDLEPECACDAWDHCLHTAALSYQMARLLDEDPFVLLLLRGRGERELLDDLQARSAAHAVRGAEEATQAGSARGDGPGEEPGDTDEGVPADEAFALGFLLPPVPGQPLPGAESVTAAVFDGGADPAPGLDVAALEFLAEDAATCAGRMLTEALSPGHAARPLPNPLTTWQDAVRLAAARPTQDITLRLAQGCGRTVLELEAAVRAWRFGGTAALAVLDDEWDPDDRALARAHTQLAEAWDDTDARPRFDAVGNRWTAAGQRAQLRFGQDGRWWPFHKEHGVWWPTGGAEGDPAAALALALSGGGEPGDSFGTAPGDDSPG